MSQPRPTWNRNELGVYEQARRVAELILPPDFGIVQQDSADQIPIYENRFYSGRGSSLFFMLDPTLRMSENVLIEGVENRDRGFGNTALRASMRRAERDAETYAANVFFGLLVNPRSISISIAKNFSSAFARAGWTISHNYTEHPQITLTGSTGAFYTLRNAGDTEGPGGVTRQGREWSGAYQNLVDMIAFFKSNGAVRRVEDRVRIRRLMRVFLFFEGWTFIGSFVTLTINESAEQPFRLDYTIVFEADEMWHESWPQSTQVVLDAHAPDDLRRTETPETIIGATPLERDAPAADQLARNTTEVQRLANPVQIEIIELQLPPLPPQPIIINPYPQAPDITGLSQ